MESKLKQKMRSLLTKHLSKDINIDNRRQEIICDLKLM